MRDPELVLPTIGQTLGLREAGAQPMGELLRAYLAGKALLLVLDNCEQVVDAAPKVGALLAAAPGLRVLATSREALRLQGEQLCPVLPLTVAAEEPLSAPAVQLFAPGRPAGLRSHLYSGYHLAIIDLRLMFTCGVERDRVAHRCPTRSSLHRRRLRIYSSSRPRSAQLFAPPW